MSRRDGFLELADEEEVPRIAHLIGESAVGFQQQGIARLQDDVADLRPQPLSAAGHGDDGGVVHRAKTPFAHAAADERAGIGDHRLDQATPAAGGIELEHLIGGRGQPTDLLQIDHRIDDAHEDQVVIGGQPLVGSHSQQHLALPVDFHQVGAGKVAQAGLFDGLPHQRTARLDHHFQGVLARIVKLADGWTPLGQQPPPEEIQVGQTDHRAGQTDPSDGEHPQPLHRKRLFEHPAGARHPGSVGGCADQQSVDNQIGAGADQSARAAQDGGITQGDEKLGHRDAMLLGPVPYRGNEHRHDRGVVEKRAHPCHRHHDPQEGQWHGAGCAAPSAGNSLDGPGFAHGRHDDEQNPHRDHARIGQPHQRLCRSDAAGDQEQRQPAEQNDIRRQAGPHQSP